MLAYLQVMSLFAIRLWRVADAKAKRDAVGVGAFNMMRTSAYESLGGFAAVPMAILEDLELGRRVKRAGLRQRVAVAPGMVSVHWAAGMQGIVTGMTKNMFAVFRFRSALLLAACAGMALFCLGPLAMLVFHVTRTAGICALSGLVGTVCAFGPDDPDWVVVCGGVSSGDSGGVVFDGPVDGGDAGEGRGELEGDVLSAGGATQTVETRIPRFSAAILNLKSRIAAKS